MGVDLDPQRIREAHANAVRAGVTDRVTFRVEDLFDTDIQSATLDDPEAIPPGAHIQYAEHLGWTESLDALPKFARYPGQG